MKPSDPSSKPLDLRVGDIYKNGIYIGTHDEKHVFVMSADLIKDMTYLDAVKAVAALGDGWQIPTKDQLRLMYNNRGAIGRFKTNGSDLNAWYWSCTDDRDYPSTVLATRFSDGADGRSYKDYTRLSCRPIRVEAVSTESDDVKPGIRKEKALTTLSRRDEFAIRIAATVISTALGQMTADEVASATVLLTDAMLAKLDEKEPTP